MAYKQADLVVVSAWGKTVGALAQDPRSGFFAFEYDPAWIRTRIELSPFHLRNSPGVFIFPELSEPTYRRLPAMLADALPDQFGTSLLEAYLAGLGISSSQVTSLDRLAYMGTRGMGAFEFAPLIEMSEPRGTAFDIAHIVAQGRNAMAGSFGTEADATAGVRELIQLGSSAGGLRAKAIIAWNPDTGEVRAGHTAPPPGFEQWIIKLDGVEEADEGGSNAGQGRIEYAYFLMATAAGVTMSPSRLLEEGGRAHFMTRRFDREGNGKVHTQTLCALAHLDYRQIGTHDYAQYLLTIRNLTLGDEAERQAFRRAAFNVLALNRDDHTKNFAFIMRERDEWQIAPAYDLTYGGELQFHNTSVNGNFGAITTDDLMALAERFEVGDARGVLGDVAAAIDSWPQFARAAGLAAPTIVEIGRSLQSVNGRRL